MLGRHFRSESGKAQGSDERLSALLQKWKSPEPSADFESAVWQGIREASATEEGRLSLVTTLREWLVPCPAWVNVLAAAAGLVVGLQLAFATPVEPSRHTIDVTLPHSQTLASAYLATVTGAQQ